MIDFEDVGGVKMEVKGYWHIFGCPLYLINP